MTNIDTLFEFHIAWVLFVNEIISTLMTDSHVPEINVLQQKFPHYDRGWSFYRKPAAFTVIFYNKWTK